MRDDQYTKLKGLTEKLTDVVLEEADPAKWTGAGVEVAQLTRDDRGDRYWCKKNAAATLSVLMRVHNLVGVIERGGSAEPPPEGAAGESDLDKEVAAAEKEARSILTKLANTSRARNT